MISRGQIYMVDLDPVKGREQKGRRPVLVVSSNAINWQPLVVTVVVGTKAANVARDYPTNVRMTGTETGLPMDTIFLSFQLRSLDPSRFAGLSPAGIAPRARMAEIESAIRLSLDLA